MRDDGCSVPRKAFAAVLAIEAVVSFARHVLIVVPAGVGVQDVGYVALLAALGVHDAVTSGAAFAVLKRSKEAFWAVVGLTMWFGGARACHRSDDDEARRHPEVTVKFPQAFHSVTPAGEYGSR